MWKGLRDSFRVRLQLCSMCFILSLVKDSPEWGRTKLKSIYALALLRYFFILYMRVAFLENYVEEGKELRSHLWFPLALLDVCLHVLFTKHRTVLGPDSHDSWALPGLCCDKHGYNILNRICDKICQCCGMVNDSDSNKRIIA